MSLYFTICHGAEAGKAAARDISAVAERLGYRVPLTKSNLVPLARAEDIMTAGQQVLPEPRREKRLETATQQRTEAGEVILRREPPRHVPSPLAEEDDITSAPRRLANRALDALDEVGNWVFGRGR